MMDDVTLATHLATSAGGILLAVRESGLLAEAALGKAGDQTANQFLMHALKAMRPDDAILSEETKCDGSRRDCARVWIIDPLDGTREYSEHRSDWAVHVALVIDGSPAAGAVALPALGVTLNSAEPPSMTAARSSLRMLVSRTRPAAEAVAIAEEIGAELVGMGSAGAKAMAVVRGEADIYFHTGGQYEWDSCAPVAVAQAAGLHVSRADGAPLLYNREDAWLPDLLICRPEHADDILSRAGGIR